MFAENRTGNDGIAVHLSPADWFKKSASRSWRCRASWLGVLAATNAYGLTAMTKQLIGTKLPTARVSNFTSGFGGRTMRTCELSTHCRSIVLKDETQKKQMSILPDHEALETLLAFCETALREWKE